MKIAFVKVIFLHFSICAVFEQKKQDKSIHINCYSELYFVSPLLLQDLYTWVVIFSFLQYDNCRKPFIVGNAKHTLSQIHCDTFRDADLIFKSYFSNLTVSIRIPV